MSLAQCSFCGRCMSDRDYVTDCGHILCEDSCYNQNESLCPICKKRCKAVLIGNPMPSDGIGFLAPIKHLFRDVEAIAHFQISTLTNLVYYQKLKISKQKHLLEQAKSELIQIKEYRRQIYQLRQENRDLRQQLHH